MELDRGIDALMPAAMAEKAEAVGVRKAQLAASALFVLAVLAGAFISMGAAFATTVGTVGAGNTPLPYGLGRLLVGTVFSLGLVLVIVGGAELFTGNALLVMAWASRRVTTFAVLRNWVIVYAGNVVGAVTTAWLVAASGHLGAANGAVREAALRIAASKCSLGFGEELLLGILCNVLVCLAVWMALSARSTVDKVVVIVPPIAAFVTCGFEHCIANLYFVPVAWFAGATNPGVGEFVWRNLLPVSLGNVIGGSVMVGAVYWFVYLRGRPRDGDSG